jgi:16S rRNA (cytosine1402-N4)-methyltransferase
MSDTGPANIHSSVLLYESIEMLGARDGGIFVDATLGLGGHAEAILDASTDSVLIGIDQDNEALELAKARLARFGPRFYAAQSNFYDIAKVVDDAGFGKPDGIMADLGVSSLQLDSESRGFSFRFDAPLDMRMDRSSGGETAADLLARTSAEELANIIYRYGDERASRKIARWIIERRDAGTPIETTFELAELVRRAVKGNPKNRTHPATRTFQALRIAVNRELEILEQFIFDSVDLLKTNGVLVVIAFHSLEDRIVKRAFQRLSGKCQCPPRIPQCVCGASKKIEILTRKPVVATDAERDVNSRSYSAKLRACRKLHILER